MGLILLLMNGCAAKKEWGWFQTNFDAVAQPVYFGEVIAPGKTTSNAQVKMLDSFDATDRYYFKETKSTASGGTSFRASREMAEKVSEGNAVASITPVVKTFPYRAAMVDGITADIKCTGGGCVLFTLMGSHSSYEETDILFNIKGRIFETPKRQKEAQ